MILFSSTFMHPHLLPLIAISISDTDDDEYKTISIYSPLMKTDVLRYLKENVSPLKDRLRIGLQIVEALRYLHNQQIMHRDLKLANVLVNIFSYKFIYFYYLNKYVVRLINTYTCIEMKRICQPNFLFKTINVQLK